MYKYIDLYKHVYTYTHTCIYIYIYIRADQTSEATEVNIVYSCCRALQSVAVCCSVLQCVAVCCSVLQCVAVCCSVLQCVAVRRINEWRKHARISPFNSESRGFHPSIFRKSSFPDLSCQSVCGVSTSTATHCNTLQHSEKHCNTSTG